MFLRLCYQMSMLLICVCDQVVIPAGLTLGLVLLQACFLDANGPGQQGMYVKGSRKLEMQSYVVLV